MYVVKSTCDGESELLWGSPSQKIAFNYMLITAAAIIKSNLQNEWVCEPLPEDDNELAEAEKIFKYVEKAGLARKEGNTIHLFEDGPETVLSVEEIKTDRTENLLIAAFEWAIEVSEQTTRDLVCATGILPEELAAIGYNKEDFPEMHKWAGGE